VNIGKVGLWTFTLHAMEDTELGETLGELEELGYGAVWYPGRGAATSLGQARRLLAASARMKFATGIVSIWASDATEVAAGVGEIRVAHPDRFLLGLGVSHPEAVNQREPGRYDKPVAAMVEFLDALDAAGDKHPGERALAALGPRMLRLSADRAAGAHPYFVPVEHTAFAREHLGADPLLAPEQAVVLETDAEKARQIARGHMQLYLQLVNYTNNLRRFGFTDADIEGGGSDRLVDAIVAWGDAETVAERIKAHHDAGADHVCIQVLGANPMAAPLADWRTLAGALTGR
jgi:probable F420-dependent oxidoreductase